MLSKPLKSWQKHGLIWDKGENFTNLFSNRKENLVVLLFDQDIQIRKELAGDTRVVN